MKAALKLIDEISGVNDQTPLFRPLSHINEKIFKTIKKNCNKERRCASMYTIFDDW